MADKQTVRDMAIVEKPGYAWSHQILRLCMWSIFNMSIAFLGFTASPYPTITRLIRNKHIFPKPSLKGLNRMIVTIMPAPRMTPNKTHRDTSYAVKTSVSTGRDRGGLLTAAFTEAVRGAKLKLHGRCTPFVPPLRTLVASLRLFVFVGIIP